MIMHPGNTYACAVCGDEFRTADQVNQHYDDQHPDDTDMETAR